MEKAGKTVKKWSVKEGEQRTGREVAQGLKEGPTNCPHSPHLVPLVD